MWPITPTTLADHSKGDMVMKNQCKQPPYSVSDWDFSSGGWEISSAHHVSPPTSLHGTGDPDVFVLCRIPETLCLPQGRYIEYIRQPYGYHAGILFHNQAPLGQANRQNCYQVLLTSTVQTRLYKYVNGAPTVLHTWPYTRPSDTWFHVRITWWITYGPHCQKSLEVELEVWDGANWISYGTYVHPNPPWVDSDINREGMYHPGPGAYRDDTEIWGPA